MHYVTWKLDPVSNILWVTVARSSSMLSGQILLHRWVHHPLQYTWLSCVQEYLPFGILVQFLERQMRQAIGYNFYVLGININQRDSPPSFTITASDKWDMENEGKDATQNERYQEIPEDKRNLLLQFMVRILIINILWWTLRYWLFCS